MWKLKKMSQWTKLAGLSGEYQNLVVTGNVSDSVKADIFGFDIADVSGSIRMFSDVMKNLEIKLDGDELFEEFQKVYDKSIGRDANKAEDKMWNRGRGR